MSFCDETWKRNVGLYEAIRDMPFNRALMDGTLTSEQFRHYIIQDAHYLVTFSQALALAAGKAEQTDEIVRFAEFAKSTIVYERSLHDGFMCQYNIDAATLQSTPKSPACHHYTSYLKSVAWSAPFPVVLAAILPCFWIYAEVGKYICAHSVAGNPYQNWIDTYAAEDFHLSVKNVIATIDRVAEHVDPAMREKMHDAFATASRLEWMFWDSAWRLETWPV